jgi:hypothetical protein
MKIEKKAWPEYFEKVLSGDKTAEIRLADWECKPGDTLVLREWDRRKNVYTGRTIEKVVSHVLKTHESPLFAPEDIAKYGYQIISFHDPVNPLADIDIEAPEIETEEKENPDGTTSTIQKISFGIGGLTIGIALGAGAMALTPPNACVVENQPLVATTTQQVATTSVPRAPAPTPRSSGSPASTPTPAISGSAPAIATSSPAATNPAADSSAATSTGIGTP